MKILLTGSNGFVGKQVLSILDEHDVLCFTRDSSLEEVGVFQPEMVINLAWDGVTSDLRSDYEAQAKNLDFNLRLFYVCATSCRRWVGIGSQMETNYPDIPYSFFKNKTREVLDILSKMHDISFVWVRLYSIYGPGDKPNNYIPFLVRELKAGRDPELTDQNIPWDYLHVMDAATAIKTIAFSDEIGIFNVGSGKTINTQDVAKIARDKINPNAVLQFGKREKRSVELEYLCADISRLLNLGWRQKMSLEEGIDTI